MSEDQIERMRDRIAQCRRLAGEMTDPQAVTVLKQMAEEGEEDLRRILAAKGAIVVDGMPHPMMDKPPQAEA